ncbi:hypothetical protein P3X46_028541 [Hevea brasiliensis]|uniref:Sm domain-containing protein n=1 Tax=Hevea brasiliensis TaxID=3981 RepID=A0ABQ9KSF5_HEVBR|nr:hypothetical protein P3X46_028541 [Hevea brasiliensis]
MSRSLGITVKLLHEASGHIVTVELKSGELYRGSMVGCEENWNFRFMVIPDMLKNAPMFKLLDARIKAKSTSLGVGRGRSIAMRAKAQAAGLAVPGRGAVFPVRR